MKVYDVAETGINIAGIAVSVADLNQALNLILLIISVGSLIFRLAYKIYTLVKERRVKEIGDALDEAKEQMSDIIEKTKGKEDERDSNGD